MDILFCFNELSLNSKYFDLPLQPSIQDCFINMAKIFAVTKSKYKAEKITLRSKDSLWGLTYDGQTLGACISTIDRDARSLIMQVSDKSPYFDSDEAETKYFYGDEYAEGLTAALLYDCFSLSFPTAACWKSVCVQIQETSEHIGRGIINISEPARFAEAMVLYKNFEHRRQYIHSFSDLLDNAKNHFKHIKFNDKIDKQLKQVDKRFLEESIESLCKFETFFDGEAGSPFRLNELFTKISGESEPVNNDPDLRKERIFSFSGKQMECFDHVKFNDGLRIYYNCDFANKICYIGYIGNQHLPTAKY